MLPLHFRRSLNELYCQESNLKLAFHIFYSTANRFQYLVKFFQIFVNTDHPEVIVLALQTEIDRPGVLDSTEGVVGCSLKLIHVISRLMHRQL